MTQMIGSFRRCEYCDFWFAIWDVNCPNCGALNEPVDASRILAQKAVAGPADPSPWKEKFHLPPESACAACVQERSYAAKNCLTCPNADDEELEIEVLSLIPDTEKPSRAAHRRHVLSVPAAIGFFMLGASLFAVPLVKNASAKYQEETAVRETLRETETEVERELWKKFMELQASEGREAAIAWITGEAEKEATRVPARRILDWCRRHQPKQLAFMMTFENNGTDIGIDGAAALLGENYNTYIKSGDPLFHHGNVFSVEYALSKKYATLEAKLFIPAESERVPEDSDVWDKAKVTVLGDGGRVLATYDDFFKRSEPVTVCIPVDGEGFLRIVFENCTTNGGILGLELKQLVVLGDPVLTPARGAAA